MTSESDKNRELFSALREKWKSLQRKLKVLVIEDDANDATLASHAMTAYNVETVAVPSGEEALAALSRGEYDLVLLDLKLVGMQGVDVLRAAQTLGVQTPIVVLTGSNYESEDMKTALNLGAKCVIQKPLSHGDTDMILGGLRANPKREPPEEHEQ